MVKPRAPGRFLEQRGAGESCGMIDQVDRTGAFTGRVVVPPASARSAQVNDAGALVARRPARQVSTAQGFAVGR